MGERNLTNLRVNAVALANCRHKILAAINDCAWLTPEQLWRFYAANLPGAIDPRTCRGFLELLLDIHREKVMASENSIEAGALANLEETTAHGTGNPSASLRRFADENIDHRVDVGDSVSSSEDGRRFETNWPTRHLKVIISVVSRAIQSRERVLLYLGLYALYRNMTVKRDSHWTDAFQESEQFWMAKAKERERSLVEDLRQQEEELQAFREVIMRLVINPPQVTGCDRCPVAAYEEATSVSVGRIGDEPPHHIKEVPIMLFHYFLRRKIRKTKSETLLLLKEILLPHENTTSVRNVCWQSRSRSLLTRTSYLASRSLSPPAQQRLVYPTPSAIPDLLMHSKDCKPIQARRILPSLRPMNIVQGVDATPLFSTSVEATADFSVNSYSIGCVAPVICAPVGLRSARSQSPIINRPLDLGSQRSSVQTPPSLRCKSPRSFVLAHPIF